MKTLWKFVRLGVIFLSILTFTPVVIPKHVYRPELFGLPYTLWVGILVYFGLVTLIFIGIIAHSHLNRETNGHD
jgi:hypothetical protein